MKTPRVAAMDYLARREHTRLELQRKLTIKGYEPDEIDNALDKLIAEGLLSDRRFAETFVEYRIRNGRGPLKIKHELKQHGVSEALIAEVMRSIEVDWDILAQQVWHKKFGRPPSDLRERAHQRRFMEQRGFESYRVDYDGVSAEDECGVATDS